MIMGIGRYRDWETYLPVCRNMVEKVLSPYILIAKSKGVQLDTDFSASFPTNAMEKALSNILSNAVKYTKPSERMRVYFKGRAVVFENECEPIPSNLLPHIFEPFYRPDFSRSRNQGSENPDGGNGLGLYIAAKILNTLSYQFFCLKRC